VERDGLKCREWVCMYTAGISSRIGVNMNYSLNLTNSLLMAHFVFIACFQFGNVVLVTTFTWILQMKDRKDLAIEADSYLWDCRETSTMTNRRWLLCPFSKNKETSKTNTTRMSVVITLWESHLQSIIPSTSYWLAGTGCHYSPLTSSASSWWRV
jgi:hypothetical protein